MCHFIAYLLDRTAHIQACFPGLLKIKELTDVTFLASRQTDRVASLGGGKNRILAFIFSHRRNTQTPVVVVPGQAEIRGVDTVLDNIDPTAVGSKVSLRRLQNSNQV